MCSWSCAGGYLDSLLYIASMHTSVVLYCTLFRVSLHNINIDFIFFIIYFGHHAYIYMDLFIYFVISLWWWWCDITNRRLSLFSSYCCSIHLVLLVTLYTSFFSYQFYLLILLLSKIPPM